jgi:eukaryotic-like serine/threonine-protein kinase
MPGSLSEDEWRQVLKLSEAVASLSFARRIRFLQSASVSPEIIRHVLELATTDASSLPFSAHSKGLNSEIHLQPGLRIGRFTTIECLGTGGMGEIWSAHDSSLDRMVALKFFLSGRLGWQSEKYITREARAASALNHPNIITIHEIVQSENTAAMVTELVDGTALRQLAGKPLPQSEFLRIGFQIADALAAAHRGGIIHGDIKPENILLRPDGRIKVLDFGLARRMAEESATMGFAGTLRYTSPEQIEGEPVSQATDIFSLGLVLFELITGEHAFPSKSPVETAIAILTNAPPVASSINPAIRSPLDTLLTRMLARDPAQRPPAKEIAQFLQAEAARQDRNASTGRRPIWITLFLLLGTGLAWIGFLQTRTPAALDHIRFAGLPEFNIHPLTAQAGWESYPALSPDGKLVAFTWKGELNEKRAIYVKRFDSETPTLLFKPPSNEAIGPLAWSPDAGELAFKTANNQSAGAIWLIPSVAGSAVKVTDLGNANLSSSIDWSPDGSRLVFSDCWPDCEHLAIFLVDLATSHRQRLTDPPVSDWGDWDPRYSTDGKQIAFKRVSGHWRDALYLMPASGGPARAITGNSKSIAGHVWAPDGDALILSTQGSGTIHGIWRYPLEPGAKPERISEGVDDAVTPTSARRANRIAWVNQLDDSNIYRIPLQAHASPLKLIASTSRDRSGNYASDGRIAFASDRSGTWEIWIASPDGSRQQRATNLSGATIGRPRWSPDTRYIAFDRLEQHRIVVMRCEAGTANCEPPVPLTDASGSDRFSEECPWWSADGTAVYFSSNRTGTEEIWKQYWPPVTPALQITRQGGSWPVESPDGRWLYYAKRNAIWRVPVKHESGESSSEQIFLGPLDGLYLNGWTLTRDELLFVIRNSSAQSSDIRAYGLRTGNMRNVATRIPVEIPLQITELSVSPDGRWGLYWQIDRSGTNIMVAEPR